MAKRGVCPLMLLAQAWIYSGCGSTSQQDSAEFDTATSPTSPVANAANADAATTITFEPVNHTLSVLSQAKLSVRITPPSSQTVTFALVGASLDASLESEQATIDPSGLASVVLTTPSQPTSFSVRASLDRNIVAEAHVAVEKAPTGSVVVTTKYTGTRQVEQYAVTLYPEQDCTSSNLNQTADNRTALKTPALPVSVFGVPLVKSLAVVVDGDETVHGCATVRAVAGQSSLSVEVPVDNLPMNLPGVALNLSMTTTEGMRTLADGIGASIPTFVDAFVSGNQDLVQLLSAMEQAATGSLKQEFSDARLAGDWDAFVVTAYGESGSDLLRAQLRRWLAQGVESISSQPVEAQLTLGPAGDSTPQLAPLRIAGLDAAKQLGMRSADLALMLDTNDQLNWSSKLSLAKSNLFNALALRAAAAELPEFATVATQLAQRLDCESFATRLDGHTVWDQSNSRACAQTCLATLCRSALEAMYTEAANADLGAFDLVLTASGTVEVNVHAQPVHMSGSWVGAFLDESSDVAFSGTYESQ